MYHMYIQKNGQLIRYYNLKMLQYQLFSNNYLNQSINNSLDHYMYKLINYKS